MKIKYVYYLLFPSVVEKKRIILISSKVGPWRPHYCDYTTQGKPFQKYIFLENQVVPFYLMDFKRQIICILYTLLIFLMNKVCLSYLEISHRTDREDTRQHVTSYALY